MEDMSIQELIDEIEAMADNFEDFDDSFLRSIKSQYKAQGYLTGKQRIALNNIYNMLNDREEW